MRKLIYAALVLSLVSCGKPKWNKEALAEKCKKNMAADPKMKDQLTTEQQGQICDCSAEKTAAKYKTKAEADKNVADVDAMGNECMTQIMSANQPDNQQPTDTTTKMPDTTDTSHHDQ